MSRLKVIQKALPLILIILMLFPSTGCSFTESEKGASEGLREAEEKGLEMMEEEEMLDRSQGFFIMDSGTGETVLIAVDFEYFPDGSVEIPDTVTQIYNSAFHGSERLTSLVIPDSVTGFDLSGGDFGAFSGCTSLERVVIGSGLTEIPNKAFAQCTSLKELSIPESVESVGWGAFYGCDLLPDETKRQIDRYQDPSDLLFDHLSIPFVLSECNMDAIVETFGASPEGGVQYGNDFYSVYDGITFHYPGPDTSGYVTELQISDPSRCEINGEALNQNRAGLEAILGSPFEEYETENHEYQMSYSWSSPCFPYPLILIITAPSPDDAAAEIRVYLDR